MNRSTTRRMHHIERYRYDARGGATDAADEMEYREASSRWSAVYGSIDLMMICTILRPTLDYTFLGDAAAAAGEDAGVDAADALDDAAANAALSFVP